MNEYEIIGDVLKWLSRRFDIPMVDILWSILIAIGVICLIFAIWNDVAQWRFFKSAGINPWWCIVPFVCDWKESGILYGNNMAWVGLLQYIPTYGVIITIKIYMDRVYAINKGTLWAILNIIFVNIPFCCFMLMRQDKPQKCKLLGFGLEGV